MANLTFTIEDCAIPSKPWKAESGKFLSGKLNWMEGSIDFQKGFQTTDVDTIALIESHHGPESRFEITGTLTKKPGRQGTRWEGKFFEEIVIQDIKLANEPRKFDARELVEEAKKNHESEEVPF